MRTRSPYVLAALIAVLAPALAGSARADFVHTEIINAPADVVWRLMTTKQGMESWLAPHAEVDLRVGGLVRTHQDPKGVIGDPQTLVNRVLALDPGKQFAFRVDRAPEGFPFGPALVGTWYDVALDPLPSDRTRVRCVGHGFPPGPAAFAIQPVFDKGTELALNALERAVERVKPTRTAKK